MGHVVWQTSYYWGFPDVHMKEQCWLHCPERLEAEILSVAKRRRLDGLISDIIKLTPHPHGAKHFVGYSFIDIQICVLISSTSNGQVSFFIKQCFISEDCTCP